MTIDTIEFLIYFVFGLLAYAIFIFLLVGLPTDKMMNKAEYDHYHGYEDIRDKMNEDMDAMANELLEKMLQDPDEVAEAIGEIAYDYDFVNYIVECMKGKDYQAIGNALVIEIDKFLASRADEITTDEV